VNINLLTKGYQGGQLDLSTLLVQKDRIFRTRFSYVETLLEYNAAHVELERAVGGKLP
jgi:outer membrane protein TolC